MPPKPNKSQPTSSGSPDSANHTPDTGAVSTESLGVFKAAMDAAPVGVLLIDMLQPGNPIIYANAAFLDIWGCSLESLIGQESRFLENHINNQTAVRDISQAMSHQAASATVIRSVQKNGLESWCEFKLSPVFNADGALTHYLCLATDITNHKRDKDDLLRIQHAVESSSDAVVIWTTDGTPYFWNTAITSLTGDANPANRLDPRSPQSIYSDSAAMKAIFADITKGQSWRGEIEIKAPHGKTLLMWLNADAIFDSEGEIIGMVGIHIDISQRNLANDIHRSLGKLGGELNQAATPHQVARLIANAADDLFQWDACAVNLYNEETDKVVSILSIDTLMNRRIEFSEIYDKPTPPSAFSRKTMSQGPLLLERKDFDHEPPSEYFGDESRPSESFMFAPIRLAASKMTGVMTFQSYTPHAYTSHDLQCLQTLAEYCSAALQRCLAEEEKKAAAQHLELINAFSKIALSCSSPPELAGALAQELRQHFPVDSFFLDGFLPDTYLGIGFGNFDTIGGRFMRVPESPEPYDWLEMPMGAQLFLEKTPILLHRTQDEIKKMPPSDLWWPSDSPRSASLIFIPLLAGDKVTGVFSIQSYRFNAYTRQQLNDLVSIGRQIAPVVETLLLNQQLRDRNQALLESDERFQMVCRATNDGVYDWNPLSRQVWRNDQYCRLLQLTPAQATDVYWWRQNVHPDDWEEVESGLLRAKSRGLERWVSVYRLRRSDGRYLTVEDRAFIEHDAEGRPIRIIGAITDITERRQAELEIRRLAAFPNENPQPVIESNALGDILYMNPAMESLLVESGCGAYDILPASHQMMIGMCLAEREPLMHVEEERAGRYMRWNYYPVAAQHVVHIYGMDVSEQRRQYAALIESEQRFRAMADASPAMVWMTDAAKHMIYINQAWIEFIGENATNSSAENWIERVHPEDQAAARQELEDAYGDRRPMRVECRMRRSDGAWRWLLHSARPRFDFDGSFMGFVGTSVDITERREMDEILRAIIEATSAVTGPEFFQAFTRQLALSLNCRFAHIGEVLETQPRAIQTMALFNGEGFAENFTYSLEGTPCALALTDHICVIPSGARQKFPNHTCLQYLEVESYVGCSLHDSHGKMIGLLSVMDRRPMDNADLIQSVVRIFAGRAGAELERLKTRERELHLEEQIRHAQKLESLGILAGGIAHDFNNLLAGILGNAGLAMMELPEDSPALPLLKNLELSTVRAADLTKQMLAYSGRGQFVVQHFDLNELIKEMAGLMLLSISKSVRLVNRLSASPLVILADATQIRQVVMNLITNASEAIGDRAGVIEITTDRFESVEGELLEFSMDETAGDGPYAVLSVKDNGCGMDAETLERIFDPFFTTKQTGRGLGMAATLGIVRGHKGMIQVSSEPGIGTTFQILLPLQPSGPDDSVAAALPTIDETPMESPGGQGLILVADDESSVRQFVQLALRKFGYGVIVAENGEDALEKFRTAQDQIAGVVLDMTMPGMNGSETLKALRGIKPGIPAILMSGFNEQDLAGKMDGAAFDAFLQKPFQPRQLIQAVQLILKS